MSHTKWNWYNVSTPPIAKKVVIVDLIFILYIPIAQYNSLLIAPIIHSKIDMFTIMVHNNGNHCDYLGIQWQVQWAIRC